jgi:hypothetical protein
MRLLIAGLIAGLALALTTAASEAQMNSANIPGGANIGSAADAQRSHGGDNKNDQQRVKANDNAYNAVLRNLPNKQYDPWHGVR